MLFRKNKRFMILTLGLLLMLSACNSEETVVDSNKTIIRPAKLLTIEAAAQNKFLNYPAVIKSRKLSALSFEVTGRVQEVLVVEAQNVKKGQVLARLDQSNLKADLKAVKAEYHNANTEYQRAVRLMKADAISRSELGKRKSKRDVSKAKLTTAKKALKDAVLIAPHSGSIAKISIFKEQLIQSGKDAISILGKGGLEATINLPSVIMANAKKEKNPKDDAYLILNVAPEHKIPVRFKEASLEADETTQTYEITFSFKAPKGVNILPGMNAKVWFRDPITSITEDNAITIPLTAILSDGQKKYVWLVNQTSMQVSKREIQLKEGVGSKLIVLSGLEEGESIVSAGISSLSEGTHVRPWSK
jgi:RND family efflux transporter MFP subunit